MSLADDLNRALADTRELSDDPLAAAYATEFRRAAREIADSFLTITASADWSPPTVEQVTQWSISMARIRGAQRRLMGAIGDRLSDVPGVDFNLTQPVVQRLLNQLAVRAEGSIRDGVRTATAHAIARGWAEGRSVPQTAKLIQSAVGGVADWKATALARTDLIGLSNGAGQSAVTKLNDAHEKNGQPKPIQTKSWLNAGDGRVRPTHQDAEGQTVAVDQPYRVGGQSLSYPGDPFGPSDEVMNCRCTEIFNEAPVPTPTSPEPVTEAIQSEPSIPFSNALLHTRGTRHDPLPGNPNILRAIEIMDEVLPRGLGPESKHATATRRLQAQFGPDETYKLSVVEDNLEDALGEYRFSANAPVRIAIAPGGKKQISTTLHEIGHWIDHRELKDGPGWAIASKETAEIKAFHQAVRSSAAWKQLQPLPNMARIQTKGHRPGEQPMYVTPSAEGREKMKKYVHEYLMNDEEIWARAFSQWAAKRSGDRQALQEIEDQIVEDRMPIDGFYATWTQWDWDDFVEIERAIEALLRSRGLLDPDPGDLTAAFRVFLYSVDPRLLARVQATKEHDRLISTEADPDHDPVDDLVVGHAAFAEILRGEHAPHRTPAWSPFQGPAPRWWPEFAASFRPPAPLPSRETPEED